MPSLKSFDELEIWQLARAQSNKVWLLSLKRPFSEDLSLKSQINRSAGSVMDNIAEGFGRGGNREFLNFLSYSRGSNVEFQSQLIRAMDRNHILQDQHDLLREESDILGKKISALMNYLGKSDARGPKFKKD